MKKARFTDPLAMAVLREPESWVAFPRSCRTHGISIASFQQVAGEVWRDRRVHDEPDEGHGGGKPPSDAHVCESEKQADLLSV